MIAVAAGVRALVVTKPVDFRRGADSLAALVRACGAGARATQARPVLGKRFSSSAASELID
jgi:hypothetical protein